MAIDFDLFVINNEPIEDFASELTAILGLSFSLVKILDDKGRPEYRITDETHHGLFVKINNKNFIDLENVFFSKYNIIIEIYIFSETNNITEHKRDFGWFVFNTIAHTKQYAVMYLENLEIKLGNFDPSFET